MFKWFLCTLSFLSQIREIRHFWYNFEKYILDLIRWIYVASASQGPCSLFSFPQIEEDIMFLRI